MRDSSRPVKSDLLISSIPRGAVIVFDEDLRYLRAGGGGFTDAGLSPEVLEGKTIFEVFPPDTAALLEPLYRMALAGYESDFEVPYRGQIYLQRLAPLRDHSGTILAGIGITQDVTGIRDSERALRESAELLQLAFDHAPMGKALVALDGRYERVNGALCQLTGYTQEEFRHLSMAQTTHPDDLEVEMALIEELLAGHRETYSLEKRYVGAAGKVGWVTKSVSLLRDPEGAPLRFIAQVIDITDRKATEKALAGERRRLLEAEAALADSEARFRQAFDTAPVGMALVDLSEHPLTFLRVNPAMCTLTGRSAEELVLMKLDAIFDPDEDRATQLMMARLRSGGDELMRSEKRVCRPDGSVVWGQWTMSVAPATDGLASYGICLVEDITAHKEVEAALLHQSLHDPLTGLANRVLLQNRIEHALAASSRSRRPFGLIYVDLDNFKQVNDSAGHATGDELLARVAERLRSTVRPEDTVARLSGDEYAILCVNVTDMAGLRAAANRCLEVLQPPFEIDEGTHHLMASVGIALSNPGSDPEQLLAEADAAMYAAKNAGGNRVGLPHREQLAQAIRTARLLPELYEAHDAGQLVMYGQPIVELRSTNTVAVETLMRWHHPVRGVLPPGDFLDLVEQGPLMFSVGRRALHESCRMAAVWSEHLGHDAPDLHFNVSGRELESGDLSRDVLNALRTYSLSPSRLILELTETHMPVINDTLRSDLNLLRERGVRIAIDDLGTGYSSLTRLIQLPIDILKIDVRFTAGMGRDPACDAIVRAVLGLGAAIGLSVVAEGVETPQQAELLRSYGCTLVQGYLYSRPQPKATLLRYLTNRAEVPHGGKPTAA